MLVGARDTSFEDLAGNIFFISRGVTNPGDYISIPKILGERGGRGGVPPEHQKFQDIIYYLLFFKF